MADQISFPFVPSYLPDSAPDGISRAEDRPRFVPTLEEVAAVLTQLKGQEALIAGLMYGSGISFEQCMALRVGDFDFSLRTIRLGKEGEAAKRFILPLALLDDVRELSYNRTCGREDRVESGMRAQLFDYSDQPFGTPQRTITEALKRVCRTTGVVLDLLLWARAEHLNDFARDGDRLPGGGRCDTPLDLFEKGPMIVRRGYGPARAATVRYYLWRVTGVPKARVTARRLKDRSAVAGAAGASPSMSANGPNGSNGGLRSRAARPAVPLLSAREAVPSAPLP